MINILGLLQTINQISRNPQQIFDRFNIPRQCNNPDSVMQYLISNGKVTQNQINQANSLYRQIFNK